MEAKPKKDDEPPKRLNRAVGVGEALNKALDPVFRKRGFASRDLITHWAAMAPAPYDRIAAPDRLVWPRGERNAGGATLYVRCAAGHALALQHEAPMLARSINRYFGYVLISGVRLSAEPLEASREAPEAAAKATETPHPRADSEVEAVGDEGLRDALRRLGRGIMGRSER
jgi:hypothetical protein